MEDEFADLSAAGDGAFDVEADGFGGGVEGGLPSHVPGAEDRGQVGSEPA